MLYKRTKVNFKIIFTFTPMAKKKSASSFWQKIRRFILLLIIANVGYIVLCKFINPPLTTVMMASLWKGNGLQKQYIKYDEMGKNIKLAVICSEDQLFPVHNGFDVDAIKKAIEYNKDPEHKKVLGASTISQQVAKNVFLWNGRNWLRKGLEVYHTFMIELIWGKKRILETYLNVAEMGKGIFGIEAAANHYFKKSAKDLTKSEAAWIAAILPNPVLFKIEKPVAIIVRKHNWILKQMKNLESDAETMKVIKE